MHKLPVDMDVVDRVLAGEAGLEERAQVAQWLERSPEARDIVDALRESRLEWDVEAAWRRFEPELPHTSGVVPLRRRVQSAWLWRIAAMLAIAFAATLLWQSRAPARGRIVVEAARGERLSLALPDGSRVLLAPGTTLTRPRRFARTREVELDGEAFFQITPDPRRPFRVLAGGTMTRVLGTAFTVRAWPGADTVRVVVQTGRVSFGRSDRTVALAAGDMATLSGGRLVKTAHANLERALAWTRGRIVLENARLDHSVPLLERWLNVDIVLADSSVGARRITANLPADSTAAALEAIAIALGVDVQLKGRQATISKSTGR
jgi:transmembrane sensor